MKESYLRGRVRLAAVQLRWMKKASWSLAAVLFVFASTARVANANPSVPVIVKNTAASPVPVLVVPAAPQLTVTCFLDLGASVGDSPYNERSGGGLFVSEIRCPANVTRVHIHRVGFDPFAGIAPSSNAPFQGITVGLGQIPSLDQADLLAVLSNATREISLARPVRLDIASGQFIMWRQDCFSGLSGVNPICGGRLYFVGTPVQ